jgi:AraC-like DNA-binding protein
VCLLSRQGLRAQAKGLAVSMVAVVSDEMVTDFSASHLPWQLEVSRESRLEHRAVQLGDSWVVDCRLGGMAGARGVREIRRTAGEYVAVLLVRQGMETFTQSGRKVEVGPGTAMIWDGVRPGECFSGPHLVKSTLFLPREVCRNALPRLDAVLARGVPDSPSLRLLFAWLQTTAAVPALDEDTAAKAGRIAVDLLASALGAIPDLVLDTTSVRLMEIKGFIDAHFGDAELTVEEIASANAVSTRYLHLLFQDTDESCRQYLMRRRREEAHQLLLLAPHLSITQIAHRCGFDNPSSFSRAYRAAYGMPPREARSRRP